MRNFIPVIITRFNVPTEKWNTTRDGKPALTEEWLRDRFQLFKRLCLPSFKNQSYQDYVWLVFFDVATPMEFRDMIQEIHEEYPVLKPVFVNDFLEMQQKVKEIVPTYCMGDIKYIISAEIDNDDLLHQDYVQTLCNLFQPTHNLVLDIRKGYQMSLVSGNEILVNEYYVIANPFVALIEAKDKFESILKGNHRFYRDYKDVLPYDKSPMFIQTIHGNNLMNDVYATKYIQNPDLESFAIKDLKVLKMKTMVKNAKHYFNIIKKMIRK